jgi:hypothetical protein
MKKIIVLTVVALTSCKGTNVKKTGYKTSEQRANEAAAPFITKELGELDNLITIARDTTANTAYRSIAVDQIRKDGVEYLNSTTLENIFSRDFEEQLESQKKLIITKWRQIERNRHYSELAIEQPGK